ncbi:chemotaxis protein CheW [Stenotrophomonas sp. GD03701]|uniref:Chemotaxis protein CheW n=1 Tax=Stenotrophomonas maltophilia TaxID=40324 RepID=A0A2J0T1B2_STEMA|nr:MULTISPECIES: chemotaxis protein CheW [Stenotrophomonas]MBA0310101.1 chemotaxis protein CheW [Stenotrophomonas maltophilia]MDH1389298.1 chemotaxis protein CheW [Stenotrophomonas sp. GD03701]MDH1394366.1 chemotaxis protein CheW [Stenotrophomonas sp. GD03702]MDQ7303305.1 chemotaxis protein CheW [Stenotrophomonas sp. Sm0581]PJL04161.1 chemotaxis protein CheW [Stenotrophomonas maltophilia]
MNSTGVLDDYLDELLGEAIVATPPSTLSSDNAGPCPTSAVAPEREPTWDDLPSEVIYETDAVVAQPAADNAALEAAFDAASTPATVTDTEREPTWDDLPAEVIYETGTVAPTAEDTAALEAAFEAATSGSAGPRPASEAAAEREPTWDDVPDEVVHETAPALAPVTTKAGPEPTWDDLPDEVIYETDAADSHHLAHTDSPGLQAAFEAAAGGEDVPTPPPAVVAPPAPRPVPAPAPAARVAVDAPASSRPGTWQELQAQAHQPASSPHPQNRRAGERTSRWLRLRCGTQAYALELLKVQEVVLPVPLLPLRGTAPAMLGIMNLRGQVVPVMDLGLHLGAAAAEDDAQTRIVVLEEDGETIGLRVSAVEDVANLTDSQIEPPDTARICQISNDLFRGVARVSQRPMILLDATRLLS